MVKKPETEDLVNGLDEFTYNLDVVTAFIFMLIDVKGESVSKQQPPYYFCYDYFLDNGWSSCGGTISFLSTIVECYHIECSLSFMIPLHYIFPTTEISFQTFLSIDLRSFMKTHHKLQSIFSPMFPTFP